MRMTNDKIANYTLSIRSYFYIIRWFYCFCYVKNSRKIDDESIVRTKKNRIMSQLCIKNYYSHQLRFSVQLQCFRFNISLWFNRHFLNLFLTVFKCNFCLFFLFYFFRSWSLSALRCVRAFAFVLRLLYTIWCNLVVLVRTVVG